MPPKETINIQGLKFRKPKQIKLLVSLYSDHIYNVCMSYVFNASDAEELTQDVFMSCINNISKFKEKSSLKTWLYRIAVNKSLDFIKHKNRKKRFGHIIPLFNKDEQGEIYEPIEWHHPGIQLETQEQMEALYRAIHSLPDRQKTVLILMKIDGRSQKETGAIMNLKTKAVESLLQRAKNSLRIKLSEIYDDM